MLIAALFDGNADCPRVELLYQHAREQFSLISGKHGNIDRSEFIDIARAKGWIAQHLDRVTVVVDI